MQPSQNLPQLGTAIGGKYRIESVIGAGGMGVVFEAVHLRMGARVAIKWLSPELSSTPTAIDRFKVEADATGRIHHPNVVAIHDIDEHEGSVYMVMELLRGRSLRARLAQGPCDLAEALRVLFPVMRGIAAAHAVQVLHRDLKPENIFLSESPDGLDPIPKVLDFGIAKLSLDSGHTHQTSTRTGLMGTYPYMAFEQLHARGDLDARVDVYALGVVLYNMLTCRLPYQADNPVDLALRMLQSRPDPLSTHVPSLPAQLGVVLDRALARERSERFASVNEFAVALEPFAGSLRYRGAGHSGPPSATPPEPDSEDIPSTPPLPTPYRAAERSTSSQTQQDTRSSKTAELRSAAPSAQGRSWLYAAAVVALGITGAGVWYALPDKTGPAASVSDTSKSTATELATKPAAAPSLKVTEDPPALAPIAPAPSAAVDSDWDAPVPNTPPAVEAPAPAEIQVALPNKVAPLALPKPPAQTDLGADNKVHHRQRSEEMVKGVDALKPARRQQTQGAGNNPGAAASEQPAAPAPNTLLQSDETPLVMPSWAK